MLGTPIWPNMRVPGPRLKNPSAIPVGLDRKHRHSSTLTRFLLRAGNRLFLLVVQVNVTSCFTEIFTEIIQRMFVCSKVKLHKFAFMGKYCFPPPTNPVKISGTCYRFENIPLILFKQSSLILPTHPS